MTTHYKRTKISYFKDVEDYCTCDKCGCIIEPKNETNYDHREFMLQFLDGYLWPDGPCLSGWEVPDLCDGCVEKLRKLLEQNGYKVVKKEVD